MKKLWFGPISDALMGTVVFGIVVLALVITNGFAPLLEAGTQLAGRLVTLHPVLERALQAVVVLGVFLLSVGLLLVATLRLTLLVLPWTKEGEFTKDSNEWVHLKFLLMTSILGRKLLSLFVPFFWQTQLERLLGARIGAGTQVSGLLDMPFFVTMGDNCVIGADALISCFEMKPSGLVTGRSEFGHNVTIGAESKVLHGVRIGDAGFVTANTTVRPGSVVAPGCQYFGAIKRPAKAEA